ncbi:2-pyrone-4,6-dicarbaxylate hydrolase [Marinomonas spartinae]|uniref:2-pyrone-4,6-dicarbaxylate hydrolase n=1 Tax=Marinomonas spartinae TaxID=1792290 RepID=A0A1A8T5U2_9GAMM|nr:amidohydrolase family protein [Marinomonas spartinae]SBS27759.1 2-pyrone-4,6-dicarbaxylate hydrolase [Marinomonas spartinae]SBS30177.1 2-pyrone-4,6-dicarbaxylate hydrolase [Marinomonas spartinae]
MSYSSLPITGIDTHAHIFRSDLPLTQNRRYAPEYNALDTEFIELFERHHFSHGVLIQPSFLGSDNHFMVEALKANSEKLRGIAVVEPSISDSELDELADAGVVGIRLNLIKKTLAEYTTPVWRALFGKLEKKGWQVEIQREIDDLHQVLPIILDSGVDVVIDHFARPTHGIHVDNPNHLAFLQLLEHAPIWMKLSATYRANATLEQAKEMLSLLRKAYGHSERFLWGSDWPHTQFETRTQYSDQVDIVNALLSDPDERRKVLIENPTRCFKF